MSYLIGLAAGLITGIVIGIKAAKAANTCEPRKSFY
jgi:hypothetical protein